MPYEKLSPELEAMEAALAAIAAPPAAIDRDRLLYAAGAAWAEAHGRRPSSAIWL